MHGIYYSRQDSWENFDVTSVWAQALECGDRKERRLSTQLEPLLICFDLLWLSGILNVRTHMAEEVPEASRIKRMDVVIMGIEN